MNPTQNQPSPNHALSQNTGHEIDFDALTKGLARGASRREVLRRLAGGFVLALLGSFGLEKALGAPPTRPAKCSDYCNTLPRPQRSNCNNACKQCGGNTQNVCASLDSNKVTCCPQGTGCCNGTCTALGSNQNCSACGDTCTGEKTCVNGACQCPTSSPTCGSTCCPSTQVCCEGVCCNAGETCLNGECLAAKTCSADSCPSTAVTCGSTNPGCLCFATTEGTNLCLDATGLVCGTSTPCTSSADCPSGSFCAGVVCCETGGGPTGEGICMPAGSCLT